MTETVYEQLAAALNRMPQGFPPAGDGSHLRILEYLYTPAEAALTAQLNPQPEPMKDLLARLGGEQKETAAMLKDLSQRGLIRFARTEQGSGFGLEPFVVGIYENQVPHLSKELAELFEQYFRNGFGRLLEAEPKVMRIVPVQEAIVSSVEIRPYESLVDIVSRAKSIGIQQCICRKQKELVGEPCQHTQETCMVLVPVAGAFDNSEWFHSVTSEEALTMLRSFSEEGLVHQVSNTQEGNYYICNCCSCCCGLLRGMKDLGIANVVASSAFVNTVDKEACIACGSCEEVCPFGALTLEDVIVVDDRRCTGCGVCVITCPTEALSLVRRPEEEIKPVPPTHAHWAQERLQKAG